MSDLRYLITIIKRESHQSYIDFLKNYGVDCVFETLCNGTAGQNILSYFGLEKIEKIMLAAVVTPTNAIKILKDSVSLMGINLKGNGIALTIPIGSMGGNSSMNYLIGSQNLLEKEVVMNNEFNYALIVIIANKGYTDLIMETARNVGANGGTVIHGKGTGAEYNRKFFGISIADEKELIYIVSKKSDKDKIMMAIMENAGVNTDAHAIVFSLPVDNVAGLLSIQDKYKES
ncbi:MAG: P-II family nitrogen regulator [Clostridia bacterium]